MTLIITGEFYLLLHWIGKRFGWPMHWTTSVNLCQAAVTILPICHISYEFYDLFKIMNIFFAPLSLNCIKRVEELPTTSWRCACAIFMSSAINIINFSEEMLGWIMEASSIKALTKWRLSFRICCHQLSALERGHFARWMKRGCNGMIRIFHHVMDDEIMEDGFTFPSPNQSQYLFRS